MNIFAQIGGWLFGGGGASKVMDVADKAFHTEQEKAAEDAADLADARAMQLPTHGGAFDTLVDGAARLVRPGVTFWLVGGFIGWWPLPAPGTVDPFWQNVFMLVLTFWFGGRALLKDLPASVRLMRGLK